MEGNEEVSVEGQPTRISKVGDAFQIPPETPHAIKVADTKARALISYIVEKDKPLVKLV